jgi:hypothetical protein
MLCLRVEHLLHQHTSCTDICLSLMLACAICWHQRLQLRLGEFCTVDIVSTGIQGSALPKQAGYCRGEM